MKIATSYQRKGGNGKTTLVQNFAHGLAKYRSKKVLLIDTDDQRNTTSAVPVLKEPVYTVEHLLFDTNVLVGDAAVPTCWEGVDIIVGSRGLSAAASRLEAMPEGHTQLYSKLKYAWHYDAIIIDTSPSLNMLTINAMCASDGLIIPLSSNYFSLQGLAQTIDAYHKISSELHRTLQLYALAFVIHDGRTRLALEVHEKVKEHYPDLLCETVIGRNIKIEEAQVKQQSIYEYAPLDRGTIQYRALTTELATRMGI